MPRNSWSHDELIVAFNLYCKIPFGRIHNRNPEIIELASFIGRTPSAVSYKLANFASLDPELKERGIKGAGNGSKGDQEVWNEFVADWERLAYESEAALSRIIGRPIEQCTGIDVSDIVAEGAEREAMVRIRVNQSFFRSAVVTAYERRCCISGISVPELLNASHIVPWSRDINNRVNPRNGLCLNVLLDRAYDRGLITVTPELMVLVSPLLRESSGDPSLSGAVLRFHHQLVTLPQRFRPDPALLDRHVAEIFQG